MLKLEYDKQELEQVIDKIVKKTMNMDLTWDWPCGVAYYGISDARKRYRISWLCNRCRLLPDRRYRTWYW